MGKLYLSKRNSAGYKGVNMACNRTFVTQVSTQHHIKTKLHGKLTCRSFKPREVSLTWQSFLAFFP